MVGNNGDIDNFLIADFNQQYEEYRQAENSRIRYVEYYATILIAFLSFTAVIFNVAGIPTGPRSAAFIISAIFFVCSIFLSWIGYKLYRISLFTRIGQCKTAIYINKIRAYFREKNKTSVLDYANISSFISENWNDKNIPAIQLIRLLIFLTSAIVCVSGYYLMRLVFIYLYPIPKGETLFKTLFYPEHFYGAVVGICFGIFSYIYLLCELKRIINKAQNESIKQEETLEKYFDSRRTI